jgi:hypothetical protein
VGNKSATTRATGDQVAGANPMNANETVRTVVALRRYNPGIGRGNRPALEPVFEGDKVHPRWNLIAPPAGEFRIATLAYGDEAGPKPRGCDLATFVGHPAVSQYRRVSASDTLNTEGLLATLLRQGMVVVQGQEGSAIR